MRAITGILMMKKPRSKTMDIEKRIAIEKQIVEVVIDSALAAGLAVSCSDGEEITVRRSEDKDTIMDALFSVDEETIAFYDKNGRRVGVVDFVYGNDGYDVIYDNTYTDEMEALLKPATELAENICEEIHASDSSLSM
jgi:hypothetical protein